MRGSTGAHRSTTLSHWGFNYKVNMLYFDQLNDFGLSYDEIMDRMYSAVDGVLIRPCQPFKRGYHVDLRIRNSRMTAVVCPVTR